MGATLTEQRRIARCHRTAETAAGPAVVRGVKVVRAVLVVRTGREGLAARGGRVGGGNRLRVLPRCSSAGL